MKVVGDNLAKTALSEADVDSAGLYAKSAYNRYYYHCWLELRDELVSLIGGSKKIGHGSEAGSVLHSSYKAILRRELDKVYPTASSTKKSELDVFVKEVAALITKLYRIREAADYRSDAKIDINGSEIKIAFSSDGKVETFSIADVVNDLIAIRTGLDQIKKIRGEVGL